MPPYVSYFSDAQSVPAKWKLGIHQAQRVCTIWNDVRTELNTTYPDAKTDDAEDHYTQKAALQDDPSTQKKYFFWDAEISKAEYKELVDIERALMMFRAMYTSGMKKNAREDYEKIWKAIKRHVGTEDGAEKLATAFNATYCPDELYHYLHYLVKSENEISQGNKPWVYEKKVRLTFASGTESKPDRSSKAVSLDQRA